MILQCNRCRDQIPDGDERNFRDETLCEDCYMGALQAPRTCDVAATQQAKKHRTLAGQSGTDGLLEIQKEIYNWLKEVGRATRPQIAEHFKLPEWELEKQIAVLRHCDLIKGEREGQTVYLLPVDG